jgi:hypothetical protein
MDKKNPGTDRYDTGKQNLWEPSFDINSGSFIHLDEILLSVKKDPLNPVRVPFPQANDLDKILDIVVSFDENRKTSEQISKQFKFHGRQGDYYANAAVYLGFLERDRESKGSFVLTGLGKEMKRCPIRICRNRILFVQLLKKPVLRSSIILLRDFDYDISRITRDAVASIILENYCGYSLTTSKRRASTVINWMNWICLNFNFKS